MAANDQGSGLVLVFAPIGRDAPSIAGVLERCGMTARIVDSVPAMAAAIGPDVVAGLVTEEALLGQDIEPLRAAVDAQPPWSDFPFIVLTSHGDQPVARAWRQKLINVLRNVSLLERPIQAITLISMASSALRARKHQYEVRAFMAARERWTAELEAQVADRTRELEKVNIDLRTQMAEKALVEETLRQTQKIEAIGQLTGGIAHDFNNLLMVISGGLEMLDRQKDPAQRQRILGAMRQATQRGASLTRQLLTFSRKQALHPEPIDIVRQIGAMRELLERSLHGNVQVAFDFPEDLWPVEADPGEFELMVLNLAVNARDAMPAGGTITIGAENLHLAGEGNPPGDFVRLSVNDTGIGMTEAVKNRVFEPFFTTKDIGRGSGLGLAQVHGFAVQSGGSVQIESEVGKGTSVFVLLPRSANSPSQVVAAPAGAGAGMQPVSSGSVLLVEDDDEVGDLVSEMLAQLGYQVTRAASASAALGALANGRKVDIVLTDIMMPGGMNGIELAREIRTRNRRLPILLTSGYAEAVKQHAEAEGLRILAKPYEIQDLGRALRAALGTAT